MRKCKKLGSRNLLKTSNYPKACSAGFSRAEFLIPGLCPECLLGVLKVSDPAVAGELILAEAEGKR